MTLKQRQQRYRLVIRLRKRKATLVEIGLVVGISRERVRQLILHGLPGPVPPPKRGILGINGLGHLKGRERARMLVRIRDNFTCRDCGSRRTYREVQLHNAKKSRLQGRVKLFDVHHINGLCGRNSRGYDTTKDLSGLVTLCHRCHYNRPEHNRNRKKAHGA